ncbi:MAG TPA: flagellar basal-body rod protein FlgG [Thermotogota bacterium]|nr:flagellar basal-body rod protein FlgG [Thermotogota bacterium]HRW91790.1 flagellar basal-body rod protein FlgG [Thermotogota bacterium]
MITSLYSAATGMTGQQTKLDTISNNLANVDTNGYKKVRADFADLFYQHAIKAGTPVANQTSVIPSGVYTGLGSRVISTTRVFSMGTLEVTERDLDAAINGEGFFAVQQPDGTVAYTRDGAFHLDNSGNMITGTGLPLADNIVIPGGTTGAVQINPDGTIALVNGGEPVVLGSITLTRFINPSGLKSIGDNLFLATGASGDPVQGIPGADGFGSLRQSFLEKSNVNAVSEMVNMISSQRAYELNSRAIQTADDMLRTVSGLKR